MHDRAVLVVVEVSDVRDPEGLRDYARRSSALLGSFGGELLANGGRPVEGEPALGPLIVQRWTSEDAFLSWLRSDAYRPLNELRIASATMRVAIVPLVGRAADS